MEQLEKLQDLILPNVGIDLDPTHEYEGMTEKKHEIHLKYGKAVFTVLQAAKNYNVAKEALLNCAGWLPLEVNMLTAIDTDAKDDDEKLIGATRHQGKYVWTLAQAAKYWEVEIKPEDRFQSPASED